MDASAAERGGGKRTVWRLSRSRTPICGSGHIITSATTMRPFCRWRRRRNISPLSSGRSFAFRRRFDQAGIVMYLDSENWIKASLENEDDKILPSGGGRDQSRLFPIGVRRMWTRLSPRCGSVSAAEAMTSVRRVPLTEYSSIRCGSALCSAFRRRSDSGSTPAARRTPRSVPSFTDMELTECKWKAPRRTGSGRRRVTPPFWKSIAAKRRNISAIECARAAAHET